jgi:hypothetical protein
MELACEEVNTQESHAVAVGRLGGLVRSRKKTITARRNARRPRPGRRKKG